MDKKCAIIMDENSPIGIIANTSAILGITLGKNHPEIVGINVSDKDNNIHNGVIEFPIPILKSTKEKIKELRSDLYDRKDPDLKVLDFSTLAQSCKTYNEFIEKMAETKSAELNYIGILILGDKKKVNKLTGNLPLLR